MDRINHVKIVTPDPEAVDRFLREVVDLPEGWPIGPGPSARPPAAGPVLSPARSSDGHFTADAVAQYRGATEQRGYITGSSESRQVQILQGDRPLIWGVAIGTRHLERAHQRCVERGISCTEPELTRWGEGGIRYFFAEVGGIVFEVMRAEDSGPSIDHAGE